MPSLIWRGADQDLLERAGGGGLHPGAARQVGVEGRHAPVVAAAGRLDRPRERRADHDRVGAADDRLGDVAAGTHPAVGDDVDVAAARLVEVAHPRARRVSDRGSHRNTDPEHAAGGAGVARADTDQQAGRTGAHEVQRGGERRAAADDHGHIEVTDEALQVQRLGSAGNVLRADDRALDDEQVDAGFEHRSGRTA